MMTAEAAEGVVERGLVYRGTQRTVYMAVTNGGVAVS